VTYRGYRKFWLLLERSHIDLCVADPGHEVDLYVEADLAAMVRVWLGDVRFENALHLREIQLVGNQALVKAFPSWLKLSHFAGTARPGTAASDPVAQAGGLPNTRGAAPP